MNRLHTIAVRLVMISLALCSCLAATTLAQTPSPSPSQDATKKPDSPPAAEQQPNPFAPEPAKPLPPGMTGSDVNDPRAKLKPGIYDAEEAAMGIKHVQLVKKPDAFQLGSDDADNPRVNKTLGQLGIPEGVPIPKPSKLVLAHLAFANSDLAFQGNHLFLGNFLGVNI